MALLLGILACGADQRSVDELTLEGDLWMDSHTGQPYSGLAFATFDGRLSSKEVYTNGLKHGPYELYFDNGQLFEQGSYEAGLRNGPYRAYAENGDLYEEGTYLDGRFHGTRRWYVEGRLIELVTYRNGVMEGLYERYADNGALDLKGMLHAGGPCGTWIESDRPIAHPGCSSSVTE